MPDDAQGPRVNLDANPNPDRAADRDSAMCNEAIDRQSMGMASSSSAEGPQASPDPKTDPNRAADGGLVMRELMDGSQAPAQEGWEIESEWLQEMEQELHEAGPWADLG